MNEEDVLRGLTGLRLAVAGRHEEALHWLPGNMAGLRSMVAQWARTPAATPPGIIGDLVRGWIAYYRAEYAKAYASFSEAQSADIPWVLAWALLGKGKVCTDLGYFAHATSWCRKASAVARRFEHDDVVAAAQGARGEALLRAGCPRFALEAFTLDLGLLPAGDRFRGRVMCYQAHAYRRLGAYSAAKLAYRISAQLPGENTAPYAYAGLAGLGAETEDAGLVEEAVRYAERFQQAMPTHVCVAWVYLARAWMERSRRTAFASWLERSRRALPPEFIFEHRWLENWLPHIGERPPKKSRISVDIERFVPEGRDVCPARSDWIFDDDPPDEELFNSGFQSLQWGVNLEELWQQRLHFMH